MEGFLCVYVCARVGRGKKDLGSAWQKVFGNAGGAPSGGVCSCSCSTMGFLMAVHRWDAVLGHVEGSCTTGTGSWKKPAMSHEGEGLWGTAEPDEEVLQGR